jgi:hypothetical protein
MTNALMMMPSVADAFRSELRNSFILTPPLALLPLPLLFLPPPYPVPNREGVTIEEGDAEDMDLLLGARRGGADRLVLLPPREQVYLALSNEHLQQRCHGMSAEAQRDDAEGFDTIQ